MSTPHDGPPPGAGFPQTPPGQDEPRPAARPPVAPPPVPDGDIAGRDVDALTAVLRRPAHRVDPKARHVWRLSALLGWLFVVVPLLVFAILVDDAAPWSWVALAVVAAWAVFHVAVAPEWRYRVHRWEVDDKAAYTLAGWISQTSRVAPISRVQTVDSAYGPIQRLFGLGELTVTTASAAGPVKIDGLPRATVEELVARLTALTAADDGDAT